jgi:hypothetical protein
MSDVSLVRRGGSGAVAAVVDITELQVAFRASLAVAGPVADATDADVARSLTPLHRFEASLFRLPSDNETTGVASNEPAFLNVASSILLAPASSVCCGAVASPTDTTASHDVWVTPPRPVQHFANTIGLTSSGERIWIADGAHLISVDLSLDADGWVAQWHVSLLISCELISSAFAWAEYVALMGCGELHILRTTDIIAQQMNGSPTGAQPAAVATRLL